MNELHSDLLHTKDLLYNTLQMNCTSTEVEPESAEYAACTFKLENYFVRFRVAKITPTKAGQFVTLWKREGRGPIKPYDLSDLLDLVVVCTRAGNQFGQFVFPKAVLYEQGVISKHSKGGKRAIRVYPPWDKTLNRQAQKTQAWQIKYFIDLSDPHAFDCEQARKLYELTL